MCRHFHTYVCMQVFQLMPWKEKTYLGRKHYNAIVQKCHGRTLATQDFLFIYNLKVLYTFFLLYFRYKT